MHLEIINVLKKLRILLLKENNKNLYNDINTFLLSPREILDVTNDNIDLLDIRIERNYINYLKEKLYELYITDYEFYKKYIIDGQSDIWDQLYRTYFKLLDNINKLSNMNIDFVSDKYSFACKEVENVINIVSSSYCDITDFENNMGLDRFLSCINQEDLKILYDQIQKVKILANKKIDKYKDIFQKDWNLTTISVLLKHMLIEENYNSPIARNFPSNQERVILFIIDGLGYAQYLWNICYSKKTKKYTFNENILYWLEEKRNFFKYIIGSSLISDTAAGLAQIFTGNYPKNTGIISSKVYREDFYNFYSPTYRYKSSIIDIKNIKHNFENLVEQQSNIFTFLQNYNIDSETYYCSNYKNNPFSNFCFGNTQLHKVLPPERVFSILFDRLDANCKGVLKTIYYTSLDNTGHPTGAFTLFEFYEHQKFNIMFTNFLIQLALYKPELFDGKTSIVITADHGMAECSKRVISRSAFDCLYPELIKKRYSIVENNRALLFYNIISNKMNEAKMKISKIFNDYGIDAKIYTKNDPIVEELLYNPRTISAVNCPDIIALIEGDGIVYSKNINEKLYHYGGHGGRSLEEVFVPLIAIQLSQDLKNEIEDRFFKLT